MIPENLISFILSKPKAVRRAHYKNWGVYKNKNHYLKTLGEIVISY
jgi:hypothetical protein